MISETSFYKLMLLYHVYVILYRFLFPMVNKDDHYFGGDWKYLTHWNAMVQILYYLLNGMLAFNCDWKDKSVYIRSHIFSCLVFPLAGFVTVMFWTLHSINPSLVIDPNSEYQETAWLNHMKHTYVIFWPVGELLIINHTYPPNFIGSISAFFVSALYMLWVHIIYFVDNFWVYPILQNFGLFERLMFCCTIISFYQAFYLMGKCANSFIHGNKFKFIKLELDSV
ncbi:hypothetical protein ACHWQZ_G019560 [Mnemiopsis leidyi]